jgi:nucleotide-binding universal stress UspA family protein
MQFPNTPFPVIISALKRFRKGIIMALQEGPVVFLTDGSAASVSLLPQVVDFAASLDRVPNLLHVHYRNNDESQALARHRLEQEFAKMDAPLPYETIAPETVFPALTQVADAAHAPEQYARGILALLPTRRHPLHRMFSLNNYDHLLNRGPFALLALPTEFNHKPIAKILFPADLSPRSDDALADAIQLCQQWNAQLHLLHVFGDDDRLPDEKNPTARAAAQSPRAIMQVDLDRLQELESRATAAGISVVTKYVEGMAHRQILDYTRTQAIDLVVMTTHGARKYEDVISGTTTVQVIQKASVPVLALRG